MICLNQCLKFKLSEVPYWFIQYTHIYRGEPKISSLGGPKYKKKKNLNRYSYSTITNKLYINQDQYTKSLFLNTLDAIIYQQRQKIQNNIVS